LIRITQGGVEIGDGDAERLRAEYLATGVAVMPRFLAEPTLSALLKKINPEAFAFKTEPNVKGSTLFMPSTDPALESLHFMLNRPELFALVSRIAAIPVPGTFFSRLHRTIPQLGMDLDWHDDGVDGRILGLNINLSTETYTGGLLQVRNPDKQTVGEVGQLPPGDAFLFRIGDRWEHRLTPVESGARTVAVGWFRLGKEWSTVVLNKFRSSMIFAETENPR